jgi:subtilisin family serine protease
MKALCVVLAAIYATVGAPGWAQDAPETAMIVTLQVRPDVKPETLKRIAALVQVEQRQLEADVLAYQILRKEYGSSHNKLRALFAAYNDNETKLKKGDMIVLPPAPEWSFDVKTTVPDATNLKAYVQARMGIAGPRTLRAVAAKSGITRSALEKLKPGSRVVLPYVASVVSYPVRDSALENVKETIAEIKQSDDAIAILEVTPELMLTPYARVGSAETSCLSSPVAPDAHCNADLVRYPVVNRTVVAVLDSGLPVGDSRFRSTLWQNVAEANGRRFKDDDDNHYIDDVIGTDMLAKGGFPSDDITMASLRSHGTHVAGIASCRLSSAAHQALIDERVRLMILKVASRDGTIRPDAVSDAIAYAIEQNADIVNMSLEGKYSETVEVFVKLSQHMLFVTAAGNGLEENGQNLAIFEVYPAKLSKKLPNVMTVAAHDGNRKRTCFSNFGNEYVDIAAPGMGVHSTIAGGDGYHSGTSQATPLVTLGAALLHSRGLKDPKSIRERLVLSADYTPALRGEVRSEGVLNIGKALAYDKDVVRTTTETFDGDLVGFTGIAVASDETIPAAAIRKVINGYHTAPGQAMKIITVTGVRFTDAKPPTVTIQTAAGLKTIQPNEILEILPRMR